MRFDASERVPELTGLFSAVSLGLVFAAALGAVPRAIVPRAGPAVLAAIPHVNAVVSTIAIGTIVAGVAAARRERYRTHRALMIASLSLFAVFLALYLYKVALQGPAPFPGPAQVYRLVYLPVLTVHVLLAIVCVPLLYYVALLAATRPIRAVFGTRHRRVGRVAASLWLVSFVLGNVVYLLSYVLYG